MGANLSAAFAADSATAVQLVECREICEGLTRLRDEVFHAVLIVHDPPILNALDVLDAIRTSSSQDQPILVLGNDPVQQLGAECFESGADAYLCLPTTTTRVLLWQIARATERQRLLDENRRLSLAKQRQLQREQVEAQRLLDQQRDLIADLVTHDGLVDSFQGHGFAPDRLTRQYRELLQAYVIMGAGNLSDEMHRLTDLLLAARVDAAGTLRMHVEVLDGMIEDLGNRSARHIMNRAHLLFSEVLLHLVDGYRQGQASQTPASAPISRERCCAVALRAVLTHGFPRCAGLTRPRGHTVEIRGFHRRFSGQFRIKSLLIRPSGWISAGACENTCIACGGGGAHNNVGGDTNKSNRVVLLN